jgi:CRISPR-associated protein Csx1
LWGCGEIYIYWLYIVAVGGGGVLDIYIATWGNPLGWLWSKYRCGGGGGVGGSASGEVEGFSSTKCWGDGVYVVYVVDSVIAASAPCKENSVAEVVSSDCGGVEGVRVQSDGGRVFVSYDGSGGVKWRDAVVNYVKCVAKAIGVRDDVIVVVGAAKGEYRAGEVAWRFNAHGDVLAVSMLGELWEAIRKEVERKKPGYVNLHIDITHGVNFMPSLMASVARMLASLLLTKVGDRVVVKIYNAVPVGEGIYEYVKVYSEEVRRFYFPWEPKTPAAKALYYGALLQFVMTCGEVRRRGLPQPVVKDNTVDYMGGNIYSDLQDLYEDLLVEEVCKGAGGGRGGVSLDFLHGWDIRERLTPTAEAVLENELNTVYRVLLERYGHLERDPSLEGKCFKLGELFQRYASPESTARRPDCKCGDSNIRNFIAHAGLLKDCITICKTDRGWEFCADGADECRATLECLRRRRGRP